MNGSENMEMTKPELTEINFSCDWMKRIIKEWRVSLRKKGLTIKMLKKAKYKTDRKEWRVYKIQDFNYPKLQAFRKEQRETTLYKYPIFKGEFGDDQLFLMNERGDFLLYLNLGLSVVSLFRYNGDGNNKDIKNLADMIIEIMCFYHNHIGI